MRCEELEAIVFSGREITAEERAEMEAHAKTCEACRALMDNADALRGMQRIDEDVTAPESFKTGWRSAIRQTPRVISIGDWMRRKGARVVGYAACAALVFAAGTGVGRLGGNEKNEARTAYDYDYGAYDTYEAYPQEDAVALYENSAPALGARSAAEKGAANDSTAEDEKKIVRNAWLTLKTERFDEAVSALCEQIEQAGGVVESPGHQRREEREPKRKPDAARAERYAGRRALRRGRVGRGDARADQRRRYDEHLYGQRIPAGKRAGEEAAAGRAL